MQILWIASIYFKNISEKEKEITNMGLFGFGKKMDEEPVCGCNVGCPFIGRAFDDNWGLEDPTGKSDEEFKLVIKEIEKRVFELKERLCYVIGLAII